MKREEFLKVFLGFIITRSPQWLAEEDTEESHINNMTRNIDAHTKAITEAALKPTNVYNPRRYSSWKTKDLI